MATQPHGTEKKYYLSIHIPAPPLVRWKTEQEGKDGIVHNPALAHSYSS